jgi:hypothetical protein
MVTSMMMMMMMMMSAVFGHVVSFSIPVVFCQLCLSLQRPTTVTFVCQHQHQHCPQSTNITSADPHLLFSLPHLHSSFSCSNIVIDIAVVTVAIFSCLDADVQRQ